jgi:flagellin
MNTYGQITLNKTTVLSKIDITAVATTSPGGEKVTVSNQNELKLELATGTEYTEDDIHNLIAKAGFDVEVTLTSSVTPGNTSSKNQILMLDKAGVALAAVTFTDGAGVGKGQAVGGQGLTFQIGANGTNDQRVSLNVKNMSSGGLGIASAGVSTRDAANKAISSVDSAIKSVSLQRAGLGALQNRLEYTVNNLTTTNENLTAAEAQIRDTDMAEEVINNTKFNILQQASQAMLAQANQAPNSVLQLLG